MPILKTICVMCIVIGIFTGIWAIASPIAADNAHIVIHHAWPLFLARAGACAGLIAFGANFYDWHFQRRDSWNTPRREEAGRFYKPVGRE